jgi:septation ring formation regulator EzrA
MGLLKQTEGMTTMNERPTPETDALAGEWIACECVPVSHSRKLERERDEALAKLTHVHRWIERNHPDGYIDSQSHLQNLERVTEHIHDKMDKLERERDEAEQQLKTMRGVMARLCRAVSRRMMPDDPTPEDRMELREAFDAASSILHNDQVQELSGGK